MQEQSQESQETMIGNWSATLNELGFKEVFIHPQRIHPAESDCFIREVTDRGVIVMAGKRRG